MKFPSRALTLTILACCGTTAHAAPDAGVQLVGRALVSGTALDKSGLDGLQICRLEDHDVCIDQATFGGWGSGLTYTGSDNVFLAAPDRGPFDGRTDVPYKDRVHFIYMAVDTTKPVNQALRVELLDTRLLVNGKAPFVGDSASFLDRLDPEGIVATADKVGGLVPPVLLIDAETGDEVSRGVVPPWCVVVTGTRFREFPGGTFGLPCALIIKRLNEGERHDKSKLNDILRGHGVSV